MPRIVIITALHLIIALLSGYVLGMSVFGVGFSDSEAAKITYRILVYMAFTHFKQDQWTGQYSEYFNY